jgi:hypothetical protein
VVVHHLQETELQILVVAELLLIVLQMEVQLAAMADQV